MSLYRRDFDAAKNFAISACGEEKPEISTTIDNFRDSLLEDQITKKIPFFTVIRESPTLRNQLSISIVWAATVFMFFLFYFFIKYLPGKVFENGIISTLGMVIIPYFIFTSHKYRMRKFMIINCFFVFIFALGIYFFNPESLFICFVICLALLRSSIGILYWVLYSIHADLFPVYFLATSFGIGNVSGKIVSLTVPFVAESDDKSYQVILIAICSLVACVALFLSKEIR